MPKSTVNARRSANSQTNGPAKNCKINDSRWKTKTVYQIYPRSFCDANGDGVGDLRGITSKLDYLKQLGVEIVWLSPVFRSPNDDNGYDISNYCEIMEEFGTMADFDEMLAGMHQRGIRLMLDLVVNHSSDEHFWFQEACKSKDNPYRDYYIWRAPNADGTPPNDWEAAFSGSVWQFHEPTGEYFLHLFSPKQPDLNWENPKLRQEVYALMRFWLDKGVDGFRMDVINAISKPFAIDGSLPNAPSTGEKLLGYQLSANGPRLMEFLQEMKREVLDHYETITVGEAPMATAQQGIALTNSENGALNMLFQFEHMDMDTQKGSTEGKWALAPLDLQAFKACLSRWQNELYERGWNSLYLSNHDQPRPVSRFGDDTIYRVESAKMLATCLHGMQGTPYVYQGEELGMTNVAFQSIEDCRDIESINMYRVATTERGRAPEDVLRSIRAKGRDNARTPVQWNDTAQAGFTSGTPWIAVNANYRSINAEQAIADPDSVFHYYRKLIALRKANPILVDGRYDLLLPEHTEIYAYLRTLGEQRWLVVCNFSRQSTEFNLPADVSCNDMRVVISNYGRNTIENLRALSLRPYEAFIVEINDPA